MTTGLRQNPAIALFPVIVLAACQTGGSEAPTLSLDEAKQVTATFETQNYVPPPRTIDDLRVLIGELPELPGVDEMLSRRRRRTLTWINPLPAGGAPRPRRRVAMGGRPA